MTRSNVQSRLVCGYLTVITVYRDGKTRHYLCTCNCICGTTITVRRADLERGHTTSCGCISKTQNGEAGTPTYWSWVAMNRRCHDPKFVSYPLYGGRGVKVCDRWRSSGKNGLAHFIEDMGLRPEGTTLDRKDPYGNYEKSNCRWGTDAEQANNKRRHYTQRAVDEELAEAAHWDEEEKRHLAAIEGSEVEIETEY